MYRPDRNELLNAGLQRKLTPSEEAQLQEQFDNEPDGLTALEEELNLNQLLRQLPDAPLSSNFTAQVVQSTERAERPNERPSLALEWMRWMFSTGLRKATVGAVALSLVLLSYRQYQAAARQEFARSVATVSDLADLTTLPSVDVLRNFDAINRLGDANVDFELLAALDLDL